MVDGEGKTNVVEGIARLRASEREGVLGVVDDDYDSLLGVRERAANVVVTDAHDLECLLCRSRALDTVLVEYGSGRKIRRFEEEAGIDVRTGLLERASVFGKIRWGVEVVWFGYR